MITRRRFIAVLGAFIAVPGAVVKALGKMYPVVHEAIPNWDDFSWKTLSGRSIVELHTASEEAFMKMMIEKDRKLQATFRRILTDSLYPAKIDGGKCIRVPLEYSKHA